jgi:hypothetical protein
MPGVDASVIVSPQVIWEAGKTIAFGISGQTRGQDFDFLALAVVSNRGAQLPDFAGGDGFGFLVQ